MIEALKRAWAALQAAQQRRAQAHALRHLDARTLKDIGLEDYYRDQRWGLR